MVQSLQIRQNCGLADSESLKTDLGRPATHDCPARVGQACRESISHSKKSIKNAMETLEESILSKTKILLQGLEENILGQVKGMIGMERPALPEPVGSISFRAIREDHRRESVESGEAEQSHTDDASHLSGRIGQLETRFEEWQHNTDAQLTEILT